MTQTEALKLALEALEINLVFLRNVKPFKGQEDLASDCVLMSEETITAIKEALAQPEQEPVAWANPNDLQNFDMKVRTNGGPLHTVPLYTTPPQPKEPAIIGSYLEKDKELMENAQGDLERIKLVQTGVGITQRTWVGLNDEQMRKICGSVATMREAVREAEAILKKGNT